MQVDTWDEMKSLTRRRFVPGHYYREFAFLLSFFPFFYRDLLLYTPRNQF